VRGTIGNYSRYSASDKVLECFLSGNWLTSHSQIKQPLNKNVESFISWLFDLFSKMKIRLKKEK